MSAANFATNNSTFRKLMGNGLTYQIPRFQRDYSWQEDHWEDLWLDILETLKEGGEPAHYMGYLVLQSSDDKQHNVIDGQQRLTTISLIVLAVLKNIQRLIQNKVEPDNNKRRMEQIRQTYIGYLDPVTLVSRSKLSLNRNNDNYFQTYLAPLPDVVPQRGFRASEHGLRKAFQWYEKRVWSHVKESNDPGVSLARFVEGMSDKLFFTVITVTDELNAYKVFETLNARGVRLSATDLLKNHLFSILHSDDKHEHELKNLEDRWESIIGRLGSESFPDFLRTHWNSRNVMVRQTELFKTIRNHVRTREEAFTVLRNMEEDVDAYLGLTDPEGSDWPSGIKYYAATLKMFRVRQPFSLLLVAKRLFSESDFESLIRACVVISFRYNLIGNHRTGDQEKIYSGMAVKIASNKIKSAHETLLGMKDIYPDDHHFHQAFAARSIRTSTNTRNRRVVRYILAQLEKNQTQKVIDFDSKTFNIEHIFPRNPEQGWHDFSEEHDETMVDRLGNMVLLETSLNRNSGNAVWAEKQPILKQSEFALAKRVAEENLRWTPERINIHQNWMAKLAKTIWRINQLS